MIIKQESLWKQKIHDQKIVQNSFIEDSRLEEEEIRSWPYKIRVVFFKLIMKALPKSSLDDWRKTMTSTITLDKQEVNLLRVVVTPEENDWLTATPSVDEILNIIKGLNSWKAPEPDGMNAEFYKKTWEMTGPSVVKFIQNFFEPQDGMDENNSTYIVPIPKCTGAQDAKDYRVISLCNELYKITEKIRA